MHISKKLKKVDIESAKVDIESAKVDIENKLKSFSATITQKPIQHTVGIHSK